MIVFVIKTVYSLDITLTSLWQWEKKRVIIISNSHPRHKNCVHQFTQHCTRAAELNVRVHSRTKRNTAPSTSTTSITATHKPRGQNGLWTHSKPLINVMVSARQSTCVEESEINQTSLWDNKKKNPASRSPSYFCWSRDAWSCDVATAYNSYVFFYSYDFIPWSF